MSLNTNNYYPQLLKLEMFSYFYIFHCFYFSTINMLYFCSQKNLIYYQIDNISVQLSINKDGKKL